VLIFSQPKFPSKQVLLNNVKKNMLLFSEQWNLSVMSKQVDFCPPCQLLDDDGPTTCLKFAMPISWCLPYPWLCVHHANIVQIIQLALWTPSHWTWWTLVHCQGGQWHQLVMVDIKQLAFWAIGMWTSINWHGGKQAVGTVDTCLVSTMPIYWCPPFQFNVVHHSQLFGVHHANCFDLPLQYLLFHHARISVYHTNE
jgi:hypothetical protein